MQMGICFDYHIRERSEWEMAYNGHVLFIFGQLELHGTGEFRFALPALFPLCFGFLSSHCIGRCRCCRRLRCHTQQTASNESGRQQRPRGCWFFPTSHRQGNTVRRHELQWLLTESEPEVRECGEASIFPIQLRENDWAHRVIN